MSPFEAAKTGNIPALIRFHDEGMDLRLLRDDNFSWLLEHAIGGNQPDCVQWLIEYGCDVNAVTLFDNPLLHKAVHNPLCLAHLVMSGAMIEARNKDDDPTNIGSTALHVAAMFNNLESMKLLLEAGAQVNANNGFGTPLHISVWNENLEAIQILIAYGADLSLEYKNEHSFFHDGSGGDSLDLIQHYRILQEQKELQNSIPDPVPSLQTRRRM